MESKKTKNEEALQIVSSYVFKLDCSSLGNVYEKYCNRLVESHNSENYPEKHRLSETSKPFITENKSFDHRLRNKSIDQQTINHNNYSISNNDENIDENSQMLVDDKKNETIVKIDEESSCNQQSDQTSNSSNDKKQEIKKNSGQSQATKYNHEHHHYGSNISRGMDLVFRNIYVSIPSKAIDKKSRISNQDKKKQMADNWLKQICSKIYFGNKIRKLKTSNQIITESTPVINNHRDILSGISGYIRPGQMLACMGPTASGKTTLLDTLSGRLRARKGSITMNGEEMNKQLKRKIGYVMQNDVFFAGLTLKQTLVYTALLRMPDSMIKAKKMEHVQRVIELLDLTDCQNTIIGDFMKRGLSGGEKKRASIACELLTNPSIMLLDEPTSGLDSYTAYSLMQKLKECAIKEGKTVIATIHQPSSQLFYIFDKLLLLAKGQLAYFGKSTHLVPFFEGLGYTIFPHYNPADLMMEKMKQNDELPKIVKAAKILIKNTSMLSHSHRRGSNASNCKHLLKLTTNKIESQADWSLVGIEDDLEHDHHSPRTEHQTHSHHHFQKHQLNTLKESTECTNYDKNINNHCGDLCLDLCCKRGGCKLMNRSLHDDDSGRSSSWTETDRSSTATFSSSNSCSSSICSTEDVYSELNFEIEPNNHQINKLANRTNSYLNENNSLSKWPTSFLAQVDVLTRRNFCSTRHQMLSKLNWMQTIGIGILSGLMWFQMNRLESTLNDLKGFLFFSISYWMLFAWFIILISIPCEREVMKKERSSGAYRLSAFYVAKMIGELPLIITLPSLYFFICYPMFATNLNAYNFLFQWLFMILCTLVAQSIGLFIGLTTGSLEVSVTVSALYSTAVNLFCGFYSSSLPSWLSWMRYTSVLHCAYENMQIIEYKYGGQIRCSNVNSKFDYCLKRIADIKEKFSIENIAYNQSTLKDDRINSLINQELNNQNIFIPYDELILSELNSPSFCTNIVILFLFFFFFRLLAYLMLRFK